MVGRVKAAAAAIGAGALAAACSSGSVPPAVTDVPALPASYQVVYRVATSNGSSSLHTWEVLTQTGPFEVSDLTYGSDPQSGAKPLTGTVSSFDHLYDLASGQLTLVSDRQPGPGSGVQATGVEVAELVRGGLARPVGRSTVAGDGCTIFRFAEPPVGPISAPSGSGHDDICIDRSGLEVHEAWTYQGRLVLVRSAEEIRIGPGDPSIAAAPGLAAAQPSRTAAVLKVSEPVGQSYLAPPPTPAGFTAEPAVSTVAFNPSDPGQVTDTSAIWSFSKDGAVVTVEAGQGQLPWDPSGSPVEPVHLDGLGPSGFGQASLALRSDGPEIRVQLDQNRWLRARGTIPPAELSRYASGLMLAGR